MLIFYEKKGHKIYTIFMIFMIVFFTGMLFMQKYLSITKNIAQMYELQTIAEQSVTAQSVKVDK